MTPRFLIAALALIAICAPHSHAAKPQRTWKQLIDHVMAKGAIWTIKAPASRTLGYDSDSVAAKGMRIKSENSKDNREHTAYVVYDLTEKKNILRPRELVVGSIFVQTNGSRKEIDSYRVRMDLNGRVISGMRADGPVGQVKQRALTSESPETASLLEAEKKYLLSDIKLSQLTQ